MDPLALPERSGEAEPTEINDFADDPALLRGGGDPITSFARERRSMIGGTDAARIFGFSPFGNEWDVAAEKKGLLPPTGSTERMELGLLLEDPIRRVYERRTGHRVEKPLGAIRHPQHPFLGGHPDGLVAGRLRGVEIKTVELHRAKEWSQAGEPQRVPKDYYVQAMHYLMVTGFEVWDLAALFGVSKMRIYPVEANPSLMRTMKDRLVAWWQRYVEGPDMPPIEPSPAAREYLRARFPRETGPTIVAANEEQEEIVARWLEAKRHREQYEKEEERWKTKLKEQIGDATGMLTRSHSITWKKAADSMALVTDYEGMLVHYAKLHGFTVEASDFERFTHSVTTAEGSRRLLARERTKK